MSQTALVVLVPEADAVAGEVRARYDRPGIPAHVTIMYPFLPGIPAADLAALFTPFAAFDATFPTFARRPGLLYLAPASPSPFDALTAAVTRRWPTAIPYGGRYPDPVPHLTIAQDQPDDTFTRIEESLGPRLPIESSVTEITRVTFAAGTWHPDGTFPLTG